MGLLGVIGIAIALVGLLVINLRFRKFARGFEHDEPERLALVWGSWILIVVFAVSLVVLFDAYVHKLPNPFSGPEATDLPDRPSRPTEPVKPDLSGTEKLSPDMDTVKDAHRDQLKDFEND